MTPPVGPSCWSHRRDALESVPALLQLLAEYAAGQPQRLPCFLRRVLLSGDWIPVSLPDQVKALVPGVEVISLGGATEASIWSICYTIETVEDAWPSIPYGRPLTNQKFEVFDTVLAPVQCGWRGSCTLGGWA